MTVFQSIVLFVVGVALVIYCAEKLVKGAVGTSLGFGVSAFLISVVFIGFDPENLAVGMAGRPTLGLPSGGGRSRVGPTST